MDKPKVKPSASKEISDAVFKDIVIKRLEKLEESILDARKVQKGILELLLKRASEKK